MLLKNYDTPTLTFERVKEVIDDALDRLDYNPAFDSGVAADAAECYLAHDACYNEQVEAFQAQLDSGYGPDDGDDKLEAFECIQVLAHRVNLLMTWKETAQYRESIDSDALLALIKKVQPGLFERRSKDVSEDDFKILWSTIIAGYIVGGSSYIQYEFMNYMDSVGATKETVATIVQAAMASGKHMWTPIAEMDLEDGTHTCYASDFGGFYVYLTQCADNTWDVELHQTSSDGDEFTPLANCKTLSSAKRWAARYL